MAVYLRTIGHAIALGRRPFASLLLALLLSSCQQTYRMTPATFVTTASPRVVAEVNALSQVQIDDVLTRDPVNATRWAQETGLFSGDSSVIGYAEVFFGKENALTANGIAEPIVLDGDLRSIEGYYLLGSGYALPHAIRILILLDNIQIDVQSGDARSPYVVIPRLAPGEQVGLHISIPIHPGWHTLHFVVLADTDQWLEDVTTRINQRFSFAATRYEVFVQDVDTTTLLDATDLIDEISTTVPDLKNIQVMNPVTDEYASVWNSADDGVQDMRVQVFGDVREYGTSESLPVRWLVFVNDIVVSSTSGNLSRTPTGEQFITLEVDLGALEPSDQLMLMAIPAPEDHFTTITGRTLRYGIPQFSQRLLVK